MGQSTWIGSIIMAYWTAFSPSSPSQPDSMCMTSARRCEVSNKFSLLFLWEQPELEAG